MKYATEEERRAARREAERRYAQSPKGRANIARKNASAAAKAAQDRYHASDTYRANQQRRRESGEAAQYQAEYNRVIRAQTPERLLARRAVNLAVHGKRLVRPVLCENCGAERRVDAHHHLGYAPEHWFDVQWLCRRCHRGIHLAED